MTTIVLAEDHHVVRQGLRALLEAEPELQVVGEAADGLETLAVVERLRPHVLVLDLVMPGLSGLEVIRQARKRWPEIIIVVLSMYANEAYVLEALQSGAAAYVLKRSHSDDLIRAVREATAGRRFLSPPLSQRAIDAYARKARPAEPDPYATLTPREREVLHLAAEGHTATEIAARLAISPRTAEMHRANLMRKLGLRTQTDVVRYAIRKGLLPADE
ncbi:MAG: response regulator transcription factor [Armatimonadetes bacterium]|nr:response regulator transcription factor [Armatimonadota bacterium]